jgi:hypothetical protein
MPKNTKGNHKSDHPKPVDKQVVLQIIAKRIQVLEEQENRILNQDIFGDDFAFLETEDRQVSNNFGLSAHVTNTTVIMELKSLCKKIENL